MRKVREILRLKWDLKRSHREIAKSVKVSSSTVSDCLSRARKAGLSWPLPSDLDDEMELSRLLYQASESKLQASIRNIRWEEVHRELKRKGVTKQLLWSEYKAQHPSGISYSRYCDYYREWRKHLDVYMRQEYKVGEKLFVDYAGMTAPIIVDTETGEVQHAQIFVAVLGASGMIYAEATWSQQLPDWIGSHVRAFEFYGGVPEMIVPDNLKSGVQKAHRYEPDINPTYQDMATHYGVAIIPARPNRPQDKAKAEQGVQQVERQILAKLRNQRFFSLDELNEAIKPLLNDLNRRDFQKLPGSRWAEFNSLEREALKPLPMNRYVFSQWKKLRSGLDYHILFDRHHYSIPYKFAKKELTMRYTKNTIEVFYRGKRIAAHKRSYQSHKRTTLFEHMPKAHQRHAEATQKSLLKEAKAIGPFTHEFMQALLQSFSHEQQGERSCLGVIRLKRYGETRLEAACRRALHIGGLSYKSISSILENNLDKEPLPTEFDDHTSATQSNHLYVRGKEYFH